MPFIRIAEHLALEERCVELALESDRIFAEDQRMYVELERNRRVTQLPEPVK
jgi:hypothetical protein